MSDILLLVVEDEVLLHLALEEALADAGFQVIFVTSGTQAVDKLNEDAERFTGVLTDIRLGVGPNGWDVGHRARELVPHMPIVYMSGDSSLEWASKGVPNSMMIAKPFAMAQIITAMAQLINENSAPAGA